MKILISVFILSVWLTACTPLAISTPSPDAPVSNDPPASNQTEEPVNMPYAPQPSDATLLRETLFLEEQGLLIRESYPPQIALGISGNLPTPCHQLRVVAAQPNAENRIDVEVYTVVDTNMMCTQVLKPFSETIELGSFPSGHYTVWVNGELVGEFDS